MNKDFERCCSFLADMIIKYAPEIKEQFDRFCYYLGGIKQLLDKKGCIGSWASCR